MNLPEVIIQGLLARISDDCSDCPYSQDCYDFNHCEAIERAKGYIAEIYRYNDKPF